MFHPFIEARKKGNPVSDLPEDHVIETTCISNGSMTEKELSEIKLKIEPVANFTASVTSGVAPFRVQFLDYSTNTPTSWLWDFGDKTQSNVKNPVKIYSNPGNYTVTLSVSNDRGSNVLVKQNYIKISPPVTFKASFKANKISGKSPLNVQFTDTSTGSPVKWTWNFSDGTSSHLRNPVKTFTKPGIVTVSLTIQNALGNTSTFSNYVTVLK